LPHLNVNNLNEWSHIICSYNFDPAKFYGYKNGKLLSAMYTTQL
jgi:hypothetical protein